MLLQINFIVVFFLNCGLRLPHSALRVAWLRLWRKDVAWSSSIQTGVRLTSFRGSLRIGAGSIIGAHTLLDNRRGIYIEENVNVSRQCSILTLGHDINDPSFPTCGGPVHIKANAWLFMSVAVMPRITIGENSVIFPFSCVTKDTLAHTAYGGAPASLINTPVATRLAQKPYRYFFAF